MQLDADRYPLLYSLRGALSPARKNAKAARQAAAKRRAWTAEYSTFRFSAADGIDLSTERDVLFVALDEQKRERALVEEATVPPSQKSWFAFGGAPQKKRTFAVSVPEGAGPGSRLRVRAPTTGQDMTVTVPAGVAAGGLFDVPLPEPRLPSLGE